MEDADSWCGTPPPCLTGTVRRLDFSNRIAARTSSSTLYKFNLLSLTLQHPTSIYQLQAVVGTEFVSVKKPDDWMPKMSELWYLPLIRIWKCSLLVKCETGNIGWCSYKLVWLSDVLERSGTKSKALTGAFTFLKWYEYTYHSLLSDQIISPLFPRPHYISKIQNFVYFENSWVPVY